MPTGGLDASREHVDAVLDRIGPGVGHAREFHDLIESGVTGAIGVLPAGAEFFGGDGAHFGPEGVGERVFGPIRPVREEVANGALPPLGRVRFKLDDGFDHGHRGGVGGGIRAADFAMHADDFGKGLDELVGLLQDFLGLRDAEAGVGGGHVKQVAFVQAGHKLASEMPDGIQRRCQRDQGQYQHHPPGLHRQGEERAVEPLKYPADRAVLFVNDFLRNQQHSGQHGPGARDPPLPGPHRGEHVRHEQHDQGRDEHRRKSDEEVPLPSPLLGQHPRGDQVVHQHRNHRD